MQDDFDYRFSSEVFDSETELSYYNYRYYSAELGRWLNREPIRERGGMNLYGMLGNGIINSNDSLGLLNWDNQTPIAFKKLQTALCILKKLGISEVSSPYEELVNAINNNQVFEGEHPSGDTNIYGEAGIFSGDILIQAGLDWINFVATLLHEATHLAGGLGAFDDWTGYTTAYEDDVLDAAQNAQDKIVAIGHCCKKSHGKIIKRAHKITKWDYILSECGGPDFDFCPSKSWILEWVEYPSGK
jgi:RHS repeat-associated protein